MTRSAQLRDAVSFLLMVGGGIAVLIFIFSGALT